MIVSRRVVGLVVLTALAVAAACGGKSYGPPLPPHEVRGPSTIDGGADPLARAHMAAVASLRDRAVGPLLARGPDGALLAYVAGGNAATRSVVIVPLGPGGAPTAAQRVVAQAAPDTSALVVRHLGAESGGYVVAWSSLTDRGESISLIGASDKGETRGGSIELTRTADHVAWVDIVPTSRGALCLWAEEPPQGGANVLAQALDAGGRPRGVPSRIVRGATGWQAVAADGGVALGVVQSPRALSLLRLDTEGRSVGSPIAVARDVGDDMDMVRVTGSHDGDGSAFVFAWTDRSRADAQLVMASVDAHDKVVAAHDALPDAGTSSLVALAGGDGPALLLWESARRREHVKRRVEAALLRDGKSPPETRRSLDLAGGAAIEARAVSGGFALLVTARVCPAGGAPAGCGAPAPTYVRLDDSLAPVQSQALTLGPPVTLAWSLDCSAKGCLALAAGPDSPTTVYSVDLEARPSTSAPPLVPPQPDDAARLLTASTLASGTQIGDLAAAKAGETTFAAMLVATGVDDKTHDEHLALRVVPVVGGRAQAPATLSTKAAQTGGVAIAAGPGPNEATVAWVSRDGARGRVHLARIDARGARRGGELVLGGAKGDASDVSLVATSKGLVVAWVDTRDGNGEVYAASVPADLSRAGREERITNAPGDATDTALVVDHDVAFLAWADPRESPRDGFADIYAIALSPQTAKPLGAEGRVLSTAAHSRSPSLAVTPQGVVLAWIEEAAANIATDEAKGAMFAMLDAHARPTRDPIKVRLRDEGVATAIVLDTTATRMVHAVVARSAQDELWLDAVRIPLDPAGAVDSYPLTVLDGPSSLDVALALGGEQLFFSDDGPEAADARARLARIDWRR
ncbi:MAG TPA: hypothetical protein VLM85_27515 [Polyangiaceae bacterium]|nr:hypothetical protein [Polyangiaceae bacterium]